MPHDSENLLQDGLLDPPRIALRIGFAGNREIDAESEAALATHLDAVFGLVRECLQEIGEFARQSREAINEPARGKSNDLNRPLSRFFSQRSPVVRLVSGLAEGADALAIESFRRVFPEQTDQAVEGECGGILPCPLDEFKASRRDEFRNQLDRFVSQCEFIVELDGKLESSSAEGHMARTRRARAYRGQSTLLLRNSDLLVALANPVEPGKPGGTLETVRSALAFELPVLFIDSIGQRTILIEPGQEFESSILGIAENPHPDDWRQGLRSWIRRIVSEPDFHADASHLEVAHKNPKVQQSQEVLKQLLGDPDAEGKAGAKLEIPLPPQTSWRGKLWQFVSSRFSPAQGAASLAAETPSPFSSWRKRAAAWNSHYAGLYRGAFVLNYSLAVLAVALAAISLLLMGRAHTEAGEAIESVLEPSAEAHEDQDSQSTGWVVPVLILIGVTKLTAVIGIYVNAWQAKGQAWNDKAVDFRYLAERWRSMVYLPMLGSAQPPGCMPSQFATRVMRQSAADWLFEAVLRSVSPRSLARQVPFVTSDKRTLPVPVLRLDPLASIKQMRDHWIARQVEYHERNAHTMHALSHFTESVSQWLSKATIAIVVIDVLFLLATFMNFLSSDVSHAMRPWNRWLAFFAALLPAAIAGLYGIRFQSESMRLAERSAMMRAILAGSDRSNRGGRWGDADLLIRRIEQAQRLPDSDPGAWGTEALLFGELIARDFANEVGEWSVLYEKEILDP